MNSAAPVTEGFSRWLCDQSYERLPPEVKEKAVDVIYDTVGCMVACSRLPEVEAIVKVVEQLGGREDCTIVGYGAKNSVVHAAMVNGGMARGGEVDAVHLTSSGGHAAPGPATTALTVGEWLNSSGQDVLRAVALGYELGGRMMTMFYRERDYIARRFYPTSVIASLSSAVTAGVLMGFDVRKFQVALGLAGYQAAGPDNMTKDSGHMGMTFQCGAANRNGVTAALLADTGCHVPLDMLDGSLGLFDAYLGNATIGPELLEGLGSYYSITDVMYKRYPVGTPNQGYAQGLFDLIEKHRLEADQIQSIEIQMPKKSLHTAPSTRHASIAANVVSAVAVVEKKLDFYHLQEPDVVTPAVERVQKKIRFIARDDWVSSEHNRHAFITLVTTTGERFEQDVWYRNMTRPELDQKFSELVTPRFGAPRTEQLQLLLKGLASAPSVRPLLEKLRA